jgi:hypothetical protein
VLGNDTVGQLAARYNIPVDQLSQILAQELPKAVDNASPEESFPTAPEAVGDSRFQTVPLAGDLIAIMLKILTKSHICHSGMALVKKAGCVLYTAPGFRPAAASGHVGGAGVV